MYSEKQVNAALSLYDQLGAITAVIRSLGYPSRTMLYNWIKTSRTSYRSPKIDDLSTQQAAFCTHRMKHVSVRHASLEQKLDIIRRCFEKGESVSVVALATGYSRSAIYGWRRCLKKKGMVGLMPPKQDIKRGGKIEDGINVQPQEATAAYKQLLEKITEMQMDIEILQQTILVLKKDPGVDQQNLHNKEKAVIADAMIKNYSLSTILKRLHLAKSSYYYCRQALNQPDKYRAVKDSMAEIFNSSYQSYGYRRITSTLKAIGTIISEKVVRRLMKSTGLCVMAVHKAHYSSYKGELSPEVPNLIQRNFHADRPSEKLLTDITEFSISAGKVYLSGIIDCYDGAVVSWNMGTSPDAKLANGTLELAAKSLTGAFRPILHSDRGCHYRWPGWIARTQTMGLQRSMSKKGCSPDNAACEGFFGRLKNECFYGRNFAGYTTVMFISYIDTYIKWYNNKRIKKSLGYHSPVDYRRLHQYAA